MHFGEPRMHAQECYGHGGLVHVKEDIKLYKPSRKWLAVATANREP